MEKKYVIESKGFTTITVYGGALNLKKEKKN